MVARHRDGEKTMKAFVMPRYAIEQGWSATTIRQINFSIFAVKMEKFGTKIDATGNVYSEDNSIYKHIEKRISGIPLDNWKHLPPSVTMTMPEWTAFTKTLPDQFSVDNDDIRIDGELLDDDVPLEGKASSIVTFSHGVYIDESQRRRSLVDAAKAWQRKQPHSTVIVLTPPSHREKIMAAVKKAGGTVA